MISIIVNCFCFCFLSPSHVTHYHNILFTPSVWIFDFIRTMFSSSFYSSAISFISFISLIFDRNFFFLFSFHLIISFFFVVINVPAFIEFNSKNKNEKTEKKKEVKIQCMTSKNNYDYSFSVFTSSLRALYMSYLHVIVAASSFILLYVSVIFISNSLAMLERCYRFQLYWKEK